MPRKRTVLNASQQSLLDHLSHIDLAWRRERDEGKAKALEEWRHRIDHLASERDRAIRAAVNAGVPHAELRRKEHGRHTTDPTELYASLRRTEHLAAVVEQAEESARPSWLGVEA